MELNRLRNLNWKGRLFCLLHWPFFGQQCLREQDTHTEFSCAARPNTMHRGKLCLFGMHWQLLLLNLACNIHGQLQVQYNGVWDRWSNLDFFFFFCNLYALATSSVLYIAFLFCLFCIFIFKHFLIMLMPTLNYHIYISYSNAHLCLYEITQIVISWLYFYSLTC